MPVVLLLDVVDSAALLAEEHDYRETRMKSWCDGVPLLVRRVPPVSRQEALDIIRGLETPGLVMMAAHGCDYGVFGPGGSMLFDGRDVDHALATNKIFHFTVCRCVSRLGSALRRNGARASLGYLEGFALPHEGPDLNEVRQAFFDCDMAADRALVGGSSVREAHRAADDEYLRTFRRWCALPGHMFWSEVLYQNMQSLASPATDQNLGNAEATLFN